MTSLPADWKEIRLGEHASFFKGNGLSKSQLIDDGPQECVHYGELFTHYGPVIETVTSKCVAFEGSFKSLAGDVLMPGSDVTPRGLATASAIKVSDVVLGGDVIVIRTKPTSLYGPFLSNFIRMSKGRVLRLVKGSTVYHIHAKDLADLDVLMPPLKEQEAIAEALSDADAAIESLDALIAKKRDVKQATMQQLLTARTRLPGFTADWKEVRLGEICEFVKTIALSRSQLEADHGVGCIHYGDIHTKFNDRLDCSNVRLPMAESGMVVGVPRLKVGDLVIADASEDMTGVGKGIEILGIPEYGVVAGLHTAVLRPHVGHFAKGFLGQLQHMPKFREQARVLASGLKVYGLSKTSISKISIEIPPLKEQEAIAEALSVMDDELVALTGQASKLRMIKEGMMQDLLTGKVRLV